MAASHISTGSLSGERMVLLAQRAFPKGAHVLAIGPILIVVKSRKVIVNEGDGSEVLAPAPRLGDRWR